MVSDLSNENYIYSQVNSTPHRLKGRGGPAPSPLPPRRVAEPWRAEEAAQQADIYIYVYMYNYIYIYMYMNNMYVYIYIYVICVYLSLSISLSLYIYIYILCIYIYI